MAGELPDDHDPEYKTFVVRKARHNDVAGDGAYVLEVHHPGGNNSVTLIALYDRELNDLHETLNIFQEA